MKSVQLTQGLFAVVSDRDFKKVGSIVWHAALCGGIYYAKNRSQNLYMHRFILGKRAGLEVDHIDGNGLNNTRANLRFATRTQQCQNSRRQSNNTSGFRGVYWHTQTGRWSASIQINKKSFFLGLFDTPREAADAYAKMSKKHFGRFARFKR